MWGGGETVDAGDLKSSVRKDVWVRIPPALLYQAHLKFAMTSATICQQRGAAMEFSSSFQVRLVYPDFPWEASECEDYFDQ
jgi:hypothetical protein